MLRSLFGSLLVVVSATSLAGCFLDRSPIDSEQDASVGCGTCPAGQECVDGQCRPVVVVMDGDEDGVPAEIDCDDGDPEIGSSYERSCSRTTCGAGVERCLDGEWEPCDGPTDCDCSPPGNMREVVCAMCGRQAQVCQDLQWADQGICTGMGECVANAVDTETMPCGLCGEGTQTRTRTCSDGCAWGDWSEWSACMGESAECPAGVVETETEACGSCGTQTRSRTCSASCAWGAWVEGTCEMPVTACTPGAMAMDSEPCACTGGTRTRPRVCNDACEWVVGEWSTCGSGECAAGEVQMGAPTFCGTCGSQTPTRTCNASCRWGPWTDGTCNETRCTSVTGRTYCACRGAGGWTCCPTGDWSSWLGSCGGCP